MTKIGMKSFAQTVNGPIKKSELGFTLMHEHIFCDLREPEKRNDLLKDHEDITIKNCFEVDYYENKNQQNLILNEYEKATEELKIYKEFGGKTIFCHLFVNSLKNIYKINSFKEIARKLQVQPELFLVGYIQTQLIYSVIGNYDCHRGWINFLAVHPDFLDRSYGE